MAIIATIDAERKLRIPDEWARDFTPATQVEVEGCKGGLLVKPLNKTRLQAALERKVKMHEPTCLDLSDLDMDAVGW